MKAERAKLGSLVRTRIWRSWLKNLIDEMPHVTLRLHRFDQGNGMVVRAGNNTPWHASAHIPCWIGTCGNSTAPTIPAFNAPEMHEAFRQLAQPRQLDYCVRNLMAVVVPGQVKGSRPGCRRCRSQEW